MTKAQILFTTLFLTTFTTSTAFAQSIDLSGTVFDGDSLPVEGVIVALDEAGLKDTTGADGTWLLYKDEVTFGANFPNALAVGFNSNALKISVSQSQNLEVELFDLRGRSLYELNQNLSAGDHEVSLSQPLAAFGGVGIIRLKLGDEIYTFSTLSYHSTHKAQAKTPNLANSLPFYVDNLTYTALGQKVSEDSLLSYVESGIAKYIQKHIISGSVSLNALVTSVDSVYAFFISDTLSQSHSFKINYVDSSYSYSGEFFTEIVTGSVLEYDLWINVYGNGGHKTAVSDTVSFFTTTDSIHNIPAFGLSNAFPTSNPTFSADSVTINDTLILYSGVSDSSFSGGSVLSWSLTWNGVEYADLPLAEFKIVAPPTAGSINYSITVLDDDSNEVTTNYTYDHIYDDTPVILSIADTTLEAGASYAISSVAADLGTITTWQIQMAIDTLLSDTGFVDFSGDTSFVVPVEEIANYMILRKATDEDGNTSAIDTLKLSLTMTHTDARDGQTYNIVNIGDQTWMSENLNYSGDDGAGNKTYEIGWCYGVGGTDTTDHSDGSNCATYGRLYNWASLMNGDSSSVTSPSGVQGLCPEGWHLPSDAEWDAMASFVATETGLTTQSNGAWTQLGPKFKSISGWNTEPGITADDAYGFTALPAGYRTTFNAFEDLGDFAYFWSTTETSSTIASYWLLNFDNDNFDRPQFAKAQGLSARCVMD